MSHGSAIPFLHSCTSWIGRRGWRTALAALLLGACGTEEHLSTVGLAGAALPGSQTIFGAEQSPDVDWSDRAAVELGVKFKAAKAGKIYGVRFYRAVDPPSAYTVNVWSVKGKRLATRKLLVSAKSAAGWREARFAEPLAISALHTYIASYHAPSGEYAYESWGLSRAKTNGDLTALASGRSGGNGIYRYGSGGVMPEQVWRDTNYFVDVLFVPEGTAAPTCGDGHCDGQETCSSCTSDCGACPTKVTASLSASPASVLAGDSVTLTWSSANATSCTGTSFSTAGAKAGTTTVKPTRTATYALTCSGAGGTASSAATVTVTTTPAVDCSDVKLGANADLGDHVPFSAESAWNKPVDTLAVHGDSAALIAASGPSAGIHADFGSGTWEGTQIGSPYVVVGEDQPLVPVELNVYPTQADPGPYPIPPDAPYQGFGVAPGVYNDHHLIVVQRDRTKPNCLGKVYEMFLANPVGDYPRSVSHWEGYGCIFDLSRGDGQRPDGWTSATAAGTSYFAGLVRYPEVQRAIAKDGANGYVPHALQFTVSPGYTRWAKIAPATHCAGHNAGQVPFGWRVRLRANYKYGADWPTEVKVILNTLKKYGMIMMDNGGPWFLAGSPDERWDNSRLRYLGYVKGTDFEMVDTGPTLRCTP